MSVIDLRSDTVTKPTPAMRKAMAEAVVDDDVIDVDPTVAELQEKTARMLGKEAALFMPSGTMTNQIAVRIHCQPGDEFLCEEGCHIYNYEQAGFAQLSGVAARPVRGVEALLELDQVRELIRPENEHLARTRMICLEITHNRGAGRIPSYESVLEICAWARSHGLATHLDGARLWNAAVATGVSLADWSQHFDTVSVCYSKGLGAPVGSALAGSREQMALARRHRKLFGGGMRQAGIIAAGALYAIENHLDRLTEDHATARILAEAVARIPGLKLTPEQVDTNIVIFEVDPQLGTAAELTAALAEAGVRVLAFSQRQVRAVTHLEISPEQAEQAGMALQAAAESLQNRH
ncbi:threonine aldolase family protein [Lignipirellula cremea]|uniref:L-allo-threonine aldolase n=1 Tax=Lignipirellula cremea TaxID=2528010 RepID=A0A518E203_9BACT|nr:GntG family PLP-dependent aldolase [Lignipirellula cremea]QDU98119.1 L-allo-threonine aldolase [Lignipirellula cremea]